MHKTLAAYEALGGNKVYKPPTSGSIDIAWRLNPAQVDGRLAQSSSILLNGPNAATNPAARKAALESLSKSFDGFKFDPRAGIATASGFGKGLAAIQGLLYLGSTAENAANPDLLSKLFAVWLTGGVANEASQLGAGLACSVVENGRFPKNGLLSFVSNCPIGSIADETQQAVARAGASIAMRLDVRRGSCYLQNLLRRGRRR